VKWHRRICAVYHDALAPQVSMEHVRILAPVKFKKAKSAIAVHNHVIKWQTTHLQVKDAMLTSTALTCATQHTPKKYKVLEFLENE
jgi:hypothetical protein